MSFKELENKIQGLTDLADGPFLRKRIKDLEEEALRRDREHEIERGSWIKKDQGRIKKIVELEEMYQELEKLRIKYGTTELSLKEVDRFMDLRFSSKVRRQIKKRANVLTDERLPSKVGEEIAKYPNNCNPGTSAIIEKSGKLLMNSYLRDETSWPPWFQIKVQQDAMNRAEKLKNKVFWDQVNQRTDYEINLRLPGAWSKFFREFATPFLQNSIQSQLRQLATQIIDMCPHCGEDYDLNLTPDDIAEIIRIGRIIYDCPFCKGFLPVPKIQLSFGQLLWKIMNGDTKPLRVSLGKRVKYRAQKENKVVK